MMSDELFSYNKTNEMY